MTYPMATMTVPLARKLNEAAIKENFNIKVSCGSVIVDAKSLLALLTLIGRKANLVVSDSTDPKAFLNFAKRFS